MTTSRELLKDGGHPFFVQLALLRRLLREFEQAQNQLGGELQDKLHAFSLKTPQTPYEGDILNERSYDVSAFHLMIDLCQIILLYSLFENFCRGKLDRSGGRAIPKCLRRKAEKSSKNTTETNFVRELLRHAASDYEMKTDFWPSYEAHVSTFIILRNHIIHSGFRANKKLRDKLLKKLQGIPEFRGDTSEQKAELLGLVDDQSYLQIPRQFINKMTDVFEELAAALLIPKDTPAPNPNELVQNWFKIKEEGNDKDSNP